VIVVAIAIAITVSTLIFSTAYAWPKIAFLALQAQVIDQQVADAEKTADLLKQISGDEPDGSYI